MAKPESRSTPHDTTRVGDLVKAKELRSEDVEEAIAGLFNGRTTLPLPGGYKLILPEFAKMTAYTRTAILTALIEGHPLEDVIAHTTVADLMGDDTVIRDPVDSALDGEMAKHAGGKVLPPEEVAVGRFKDALEKAVRARGTERILEEAGIDDVVDEALRGLKITDGADLLRDVSDHFKVAPQEWWVTRIECPSS
jgi:hypothetical protein